MTPFGAIAQAVDDRQQMSLAVSVDLTEEENAWINAHPVIRATSKLNTLPNEFIRAGRPVGFSIDYLNLVAENVGLEVNYIYGYSWAELLDKLEDREIDVSHNIFKNENRDTFLDFTDPYMNLEPAIFGRLDSSPIHSVSALEGKKVGIITGWALNDAYKEKYPDLTFIEFENSLAAALQVSEGNLDYFIATLFVAQSVIDRNFVTNVKFVGDTDFLEISNNDGARIAVRNDWPILYSILKKGMEAISEEQYIALTEKWLMPSSRPDNINLTADEIDWLQNNNVIKVAVDRSLLPIDAIDSDDNISGISGAYLDIISEKLGVQFVWAGNETFGGGLSMVQSKEADIVSAVSKSGNRSEYLLFSESYISIDSVIFGREGEDIFGDMEGLIGRTIAMPEAFDITGWIKRDYPGINIIETKDKIEALKLVSAGVAEAHVGSVAITSHNINALNITNMVVAGVTPFKTDLSIGIRSDHTLLASAIEKAMASITPEERSAINREWFVLRNEPRTNYTLIWQILLAAAAVVGLILTWNFSLRKEMQLRKASEERFRQIAETVDGVFFICEPDLSKVNYISPNFEKWTNLPCDEIYKKIGIWYKFIHPNDLKIFSQIVERAIGSGFRSPLPDYRIIDSDGKTRWIATQVHPVYDDNGLLHNVIGFMTDITVRIRARAKFNEISNQFQNAFNYASHGMALIGVDGKFQRVNNALCEILGYEDYELLELDIKSITHPDDRELSEALMKEVVDGQRLSFQLEKKNIRKNGSYLPTQLNVSLVRDNKGRPIHFVAQIQDLSTLKEREEQLRHSQKMDAVGKLTGGIAHDFNNILGIILGNLEILKATMPKEPKTELRLEKALKGVNRGSGLIKKLLSFSRKTMPKTGPINANECIVSLIDLIKRTFTVSINVEDKLEENLWPIDVDNGELEDAILNLALNARDAMDGDGTLTISTENIYLDEEYQNLNPGAAVGEHVVISVSDTGEGIADENRDKILEPFFTTKPVNKGTGLGLSMVHGFVQRSKGHMKIYSEVGQGSTFRIYIPRSTAVSTLQKSEPVDFDHLPRGKETILIVDDEENLCDIAEAQLKDLGYSVHIASNASSALEILSENENVDLFFSDIVMPDNMDGYKIATSALKINPSLKILLTSGYSKNLDKRTLLDDEQLKFLSSNLLQKPYNRKDLAYAVRRSLDH